MPISTLRKPASLLVYPENARLGKLHSGALCPNEISYGIFHFPGAPICPDIARINNSIRARLPVQPKASGALFKIPLRAGRGARSCAYCRQFHCNQLRDTGGGIAVVYIATRIAAVGLFQAPAAIVEPHAADLGCDWPCRAAAALGIVECGADRPGNNRGF